MLTKEIIKEALKAFHIEDDAILLVHSSLKALGYIDGGAETVIAALEDTVPVGTLVMPTFSQTNWDTVFEDWHMDRPSDTGRITEVFRTQKGSLRSDNPTHSVAARGKHAADLVGGDPKGGERYGIFGEYCFSHESPWQRMYDSRTRYGVKSYVMFWGVSMRYHTFKHFSEYRFVEEVLSRISDEAERERIKSELDHYPYPGGPDMVWPFYSSTRFFDELEKQGIAKRISLGEGEVICCDVFDCVNATEKAIWERTEEMIVPPAYKWYQRALPYMK